MERFRHVLAALDLGREGDRLTPGSRKALDRAEWIARRVQASLTLLHSDQGDEYWDPDTDQFVPAEGTSAARQKALEVAVAEISKGGIAAKGVIRSEPAWLAVIQEVLLERVDVVVAAKRTDVRSDERKLGTVARKLLRKCPCAVWLEDPRESADPAVILAATDLTAVGDRVVELAASVAYALGAELHVVHAYSISIEAQLEGGESRREWERGERVAAREHIQNVLASTPIEGAAKLHVGVTSPTQAILQGVEALRPGLVVMGTVSRGGIPGFLMGNTAERLIDRIDCALLTVKPEDFVCPIALPHAS